MRGACWRMSARSTPQTDCTPSLAGNSWESLHFQRGIPAQKRAIVTKPSFDVYAPKISQREVIGNENKAS
jgi:hypothetical protein